MQKGSSSAMLLPFNEWSTWLHQYLEVIPVWIVVAFTGWDTRFGVSWATEPTTLIFPRDGELWNFAKVEEAALDALIHTGEEDDDTAVCRIVSITRVEVPA